MKSTVIGIALAVVGMLFSPAGAGIKTFHFTMDEGQVVPPTGSPGTGCCKVFLDDVSGVVEVTCTYQDLDSGAIASHIHGPAAAGFNAGVIIPLTPSGGTSGTIIGGGVLTAAQVADMQAGLHYVNLHSNLFPGGEIRGQVVMDLPCQPEVPTVSEWGLIGMWLLLLTTATLVLRHRRSVAA